MAHVWYHCCGVGEQLGEIPITIHDCTFANVAIVIKRWHNESDEHFAKRDAKLNKLIEKIAQLATPPHVKVEMYNFPPSYVHPEP
jgi:hypothetical protein